MPHGTIHTWNQNDQQTDISENWKQQKNGPLHFEATNGALNHLYWQKLYRPEKYYEIPIKFVFELKNWMKYKIILECDVKVVITGQVVHNSSSLVFTIIEPRGRIKIACLL